MNTRQFNHCVDTLSDPLLRFVLSIVHDYPDAEDIIQESYTRLWENRADILPNTEKSYLFTIAYRLSITLYRSQKRHPKTSIDTYTTTAHTSAPYDNNTELVWGELDKLPAIQRTLVVLCDWEGYSYQEIAQITSLTEGQVKIGIYRARQILRSRLANLRKD